MAGVVQQILAELRQTRGTPTQKMDRVGSYLGKGIVTEKPYVSDDKLMFNVSDIHKTANPLAKLFRLIMYKLRITPEIYRDAAISHGINVGKSASQITTILSNSRKAIFGDNLTVMQLERNLSFAGQEIVDMSVTIRDANTGELRTFNLSDIADLSIPTEIDNVIDSDDDD